MINIIIIRENPGAKSWGVVFWLFIFHCWFIQEVAERARIALEAENKV